MNNLSSRKTLFSSQVFQELKGFNKANSFYLSSCYKTACVCGCDRDLARNTHVCTYIHTQRQKCLLALLFMNNFKSIFLLNCGHTIREHGAKVILTVPELWLQIRRQPWGACVYHFLISRMHPPPGCEEHFLLQGDVNGPASHCSSNPEVAWDCS